MSKKNNNQAKKDNFNQAMFEMFGIGKEPDKAGVPEGNLSDYDVMKDPILGFDTNPVESAPIAAEPAPKAAEPAPKAAEPAPKAAEPARSEYSPFESSRRSNCTFLAEGTSMEGSLRCVNDVEICGDFKGELYTEGKATIHANTMSNVTAGDLVLVDCSLTGDAQVKNTVTVNEKSTITGNVAAANLICSGTIRGNLTVSGNITLTESAQVFGDIKSDTLAISRGAKVSGKVEMGISL